MTKREEWKKMIECVEKDSASKEEIIRFLKANQPKEGVKKVPCICGAKSCDIAEWWNGRTGCCFLRCRKCDRESEEAKTVTQAKRNWNEMIKKESENNGSEN
jgi:hypothetical protein